MDVRRHRPLQQNDLGFHVLLRGELELERHVPRLNLGGLAEANRWPGAAQCGGVNRGMIPLLDLHRTGIDRRLLGEPPLTSRASSATRRRFRSMTVSPTLRRVISPLGQLDGKLCEGKSGQEPESSGERADTASGCEPHGGNPNLSTEAPVAIPIRSGPASRCVIFQVSTSHPWAQ